jgi:hypothetical protein
VELYRTTEDSTVAASLAIRGSWTRHCRPGRRPQGSRSAAGIPALTADHRRAEEHPFKSWHDRAPGVAELGGNERKLGAEGGILWAAAEYLAGEMRW